MQTNTFWLTVGGLCLAVTLKIISRSLKPIQLFIKFKCYIHANLLKSASWFMRHCAHKHLLAPIWQFKSRSDLEKYVKVTKTISAFHHVPILYPCKSGWNLPTSSWDMVHISTFWLRFGSLCPAVTLKIRSWSPKHNQLFIMSQCYIHANLLTIHPPVHEISCK